jgi:hypothetical protein
MENKNNEIHLDREEARAGSTPGIVRYVLGISLVLVVIAFTVIVMTGALNSNQDTNATDSAHRAVVEENAAKK